MKDVYIHPTADVADTAKIGENTKIWHQCQIRENVIIGDDCIIGKGVYIDHKVRIGSRCKVQNGVSIYHGVTIEDGVFLGPHCVFTNDLRPRAITPDGSLRGVEDWIVEHTLVKKGASIGANAVIVCGVVIGAWAMIGAGSVVTKDVPEFGLVYGNPARISGFVCKCGARVTDAQINGEIVLLDCSDCGQEITVPIETYKQVEQEE
jgi:UDP-2-acetamido-3-amino-2,3-dideoxy-glucuronate N-acetyltransferase